MWHVASSTTATLLRPSGHHPSPAPSRPASTHASSATPRASVPLVRRVQQAPRIHWGGAAKRVPAKADPQWVNEGRSHSNGATGSGSQPTRSTHKSAPRHMACTKRRVSAETPFGFLSGAGRTREWCPERDSPCAQAPKKNEPLADSAPGLAAPPPHLFRTPFRHAYAGLRTCRRHESLPSQYALPALTRLVRRSHHRRFISLPSRHRHRRPM